MENIYPIDSSSKKTNNYLIFSGMFLLEIYCLSERPHILQDKSDIPFWNLGHFAYCENSFELSSFENVFDMGSLHLYGCN